MPKLSPARQNQRRDHILDAAERCFVRAGFHATTIQDICREAGVSAGGAYLYFKSKEELIAGLIERDRARIVRDFAELAHAPDLLTALNAMLRHILFEEPESRRRMMLEVAAESLRNPAITPACAAVDRQILTIFRDALAAHAAAGRITPQHDLDIIAELLLALGEGIIHRATLDKGFDPERALPAFNEAIRQLIGAPQIAARPTLRSA